MRKILVIGIIAVHLFGNTELYQLFRVPKLISHFFQHHRHDHSLSFLAFLSMHYGGNDGTQDDDFEDSKLPCHSGSSYSLSSSYIACLKTSFLSVAKAPEPRAVYGGRVLANDPSDFVLAILRPPQLV